MAVALGLAEAIAKFKEGLTRSEAGGRSPFCLAFPSFTRDYHVGVLRLCRLKKENLHLAGHLFREISDRIE